MAQQLSIGHLGYAIGQHSDTTGATQTVMGDTITGGEIQLPGDFLATPSGVSGSATIANGTTEVFQMDFTGMGSLFLNKIAPQNHNFEWSVSPTGVYYVDFLMGYEAEIGCNDNSIPGTITCKFRDYFNSDVQITKTMIVN